jgi:hypothetical protein
MLAYRRCPAPLDSKPLGLHQTQCGSVLILMALFRRRYRHPIVSRLRRLFSEVLLSSAIAGFVATWAFTTINPQLPANPGKMELLMELIAAGGAGAVAYVASAAVLHIPEQTALIRWGLRARQHGGDG